MIILFLFIIILPVCNGNISIISGQSGKQGYSGDYGASKSSLLRNTQSIYIDILSNIYIADTTNHVIRKISSTKYVINTIAGTGYPGYSGDYGTPTSYNLNFPYGVYVDFELNIYVSDTNNHVVRKIIKTDTGLFRMFIIAGEGGKYY
jgi:hypothetical protein